MRIAVMTETRAGERRVALAPSAMRDYKKREWTLRLEAGAGTGASITDEEFRDADVEVVAGREAALEGAEVVLKVQPPSLEEVTALPRGCALVCHLNPLGPTEVIEALAEREVSSFAVELVPRITRAQKMDVLSSQATVAGYMAVLRGAGAVTRFLPMLTTAAGTIRPAKAMILGAGVAGLQAIATARRLGAVVSAFDVRPAVKEQVESLGAKFLEADLDEGAEDEGGYAKALSEEQHQRELDLIAAHVPEMDLVVTTAQIPGRPAPLLVTKEMVESMRPGSAVVDLACESGGNCALSSGGETVHHNGVAVLGPANLPAELPYHASEMYARNLAAFVCHLFDDALATDAGGTDADAANAGEADADSSTAAAINPEDEITAATCVTRDGEVVNERVRANLAGATEQQR